MDTSKSLDMNADEFRRWGYYAIDWIADYLANSEEYPVMAQIEPGAIREQLPSSPPEAGEPMEEIFADLQRVLVPGLTHWNHPDFFAYFANTGSCPGILGELLTAAFNVNAMLWKTSPSATELEEVVLDWLRQMLEIPENYMGVVYDSASIGTFHAFAAARQAIEEHDVLEHGVAGPEAPRLRLYTSEQAHSSVERGALAIGLGKRGIVKIGVDDQFRLKVKELEGAIERDFEQGWRPFCVSATVGTTSTTSIDPLIGIADLCERYGLWFHVDAAYAGSAAILPELRYILEGCELADSLVVNPHKWLFTPMDFSAFYCRKPEILKKAFSVTPEYLKTIEGDTVTNYMDYGIHLGRRFRALKFWMIVRYFGVEGLRERIREHIRLGKLFGSWVEENPVFTLVAPVIFSTVCFRVEGSDQQNQTLLHQINASGKAFLSHTTLENRLTLRFTVGNLRTEEQHVRRTWNLIESLVSELK